MTSSFQMGHSSSSIVLVSISCVAFVLKIANTFNTEMECVIKCF